MPRGRRCSYNRIARMWRLDHRVVLRVGHGRIQYKKSFLKDAWASKSGVENSSIVRSCCLKKQHFVFSYLYVVHSQSRFSHTNVASRNYVFATSLADANKKSPWITTNFEILQYDNGFSDHFCGKLAISIDSSPNLQDLLMPGVLKGESPSKILQHMAQAEISRKKFKVSLWMRSSRCAFLLAHFQLSWHALGLLQEIRLILCHFDSDDMAEIITERLLLHKSITTICFIVLRLLLSKAWKSLQITWC